MAASMLSFLLKTLGFAALFFVVIDLITWRGIRFFLRKWPEGKVRRFKIAYAGLTLFCILAFSSFFVFPQLGVYVALRTYTLALIFIWYLSKLVFALFVLVNDLVTLLKKLFKKQPVPVESLPETVPAENTMTRSKFIYQTGIAVAAAPLFFLTKGIVKGAYDYRIHRVQLHLPNLHPAFKGLKIAQMSDIHSGSFMNKEAVSRGVKMVMDLKPDLFFFTGDIVNNFAYEMNDYLEIFMPIKAPMGTYSILGNHDYGLYHNWENEQEKQKNFEGVVNLHKALNWQLMRNEHEVISYRGGKLGLVGVENWGNRGRFPKEGDVDAAVKGMEQVPVKLLLSHDPSHWDEVVRKKNPDMDVMFAGHTHGMQFGVENSLIKWSPVQYIYKQWAGLYQEGNQQLYVNRGFGFIGYPGRVGILPEITLFELV